MAWSPAESSRNRPAPQVVHVETHSHQFAVREMLQELIEEMSELGLEENSVQRVELVMAEALNNVFEHACGYQDGVYFATKARFVPPCLTIEIVDHGTPMPGFSLPKQAHANARAPRTDVPRQALPEGGWGWMLIRDLTDSISYERQSDSNHLHIQMQVT